jgi:hypothetical protein
MLRSRSEGLDALNLTLASCIARPWPVLSFQLQLNLRERRATRSRNAVAGFIEEGKPRKHGPKEMKGMNHAI